VNYRNLEITRKGDLATRYEDLRTHVIGDYPKIVGNGLGLSLFMAGGMAAWMMVFLTERIKLSVSRVKITPRIEGATSTCQVPGMIAIMTDMMITQIDKELR